MRWVWFATCLMAIPLPRTATSIQVTTGIRRPTRVSIWLSNDMRVIRGARTGL